ncbi:site-specific integrase [Shewanella sp. UCD-KL21]|uniref:tyrosine-type recombinase/integrase n=1 Tax=Shewanella sp. UCD-KL21 TaxID=1917164 RepID=UPI000971069B|nr:site-specific integrase [Shewanella sp. UCD-KL21]
MSKSIGVEKRNKDRERHRRNLKIKADKLVEKHFPSGAAFPPLQDFNLTWGRLIEDLPTVFTSIRDLKSGFNRCNSVVTKRAEPNNINLTMPSFMVTQKAEKTIHSQALIQDGLVFQKLYNRWFTELSLNGHCDSIAKAYRSIIFSFICHSGCLNHHLIRALSAQLNTQLNISTIDNLPFISLIIDEHGYHTNVTTEECKTTEMIWYLSPITISCIKHFLQLKQHNPNIHWQAPLDNKTIHALLIDEYEDKELLPTNLKRLVKSAISIIQFLPNVRINQAMLEYAMGRNKAYSLPKDNLARLVTTPIVTNPKLNFYSPVRSIEPKGLRDTIPTLPCSKFFQILSQTLKETGNKKLTSKSLKQHLNTLESTLEISIAQEVLLKWYIHKLKTCKPSTIRTYHSTLSRKWLYTTESIDLTDADEQDFQDLYNELIELTKGLATKTQLACRLSDFHAFSVQNFGFPLLLEPINKGSKYKHHTNAGFVDETLFKALLDTVDGISDLDFKNKATIKSILIISYRCGLRISEAIKLRLKDIESSPEHWIEIRSNNFSDNKSTSSLRKVPFYALLLEHEKEIIDESLKIARQEQSTAPDTCLAFTIGQDINKPIDKFLLSNFTKTALRQLSGIDNLVFHHLRHSAISRLQLIFELNEDSAKHPEIVPYSTQQIHKIINVLAGKTQRNKYYAIAAFDGHSSPETCFNHYFHFCDLVLYSNLLSMKLKATKKQLLNLNLGSRRNLSNQAKLRGMDYHWTVSSFLDFTVKKINIIPIQAPKPKQLTTIKLEPKSKSKLIANIDTCYLILKQIEQGLDPIELAFKYHIESSDIQKWHKNAIKLMAITTNYDNPRLQTQSTAYRFLPSKPKSASELKWLSSIITKVRQQFPNDKHNIKWALDYGLNNKNSSKSGIYFSTPKELEHFIEAFSFAIPKSKWRIQTISINQSPMRQLWESAYRGIQTQTSKLSSHKGRQGHGAVWLELRHSDEKKIMKARKQKKYSSNTVIFLIHMMGIMMKSY